MSSALNSHPLFVHFPIAFWLGALLFWCLAMWRRSEELFKVGRWLLYLGTLGAGAAILSGFDAAGAMGHDAPGHGLVHVHRNFMIATSILALITAVVAFARRGSASAGSRWLQLALLAATVGVCSLGADRGGMLVFRYGIGTRGETPPAVPHDHEHGGAEPPHKGEGHDHK